MLAKEITKKLFFISILSIQSLVMAYEEVVIRTDLPEDVARYIHRKHLCHHIELNPNITESQKIERRIELECKNLEEVERHLRHRYRGDLRIIEAIDN